MVDDTDVYIYSCTHCKGITICICNKPMLNYTSCYHHIRHDNITILLNISYVTILQKQAQHIHTAPHSISSYKLTVMAIPTPSIPKQNDVSYMAGLLIRKYAVENCEMCCNLLKVEKLPKSSSVSQFELLRFQSYRESNYLFPLQHCFLKFSVIQENAFLHTVW